jgi:hypothetical protein
MTLNVVGSVDAQKTEPFIEFLLFKIILFLFFEQKDRTNNVECCMYKVTKLERTLPEL